MTTDSEQSPRDREDAQLLAAWLAQIDKKLGSIQSMLNFFVVLSILGMIVGACSVLFSF